MSSTYPVGVHLFGSFFSHHDWKTFIFAIRLPSSQLLFPSGFFEMKMKYDESDNALIRASRAVTDRVTDFLGNAPPHMLL